MSKATELVKAIKNYIIENGINPKITRTAKEWNEELGTNYSPATFTSAVNAGLMEKRRYKQNEAYYYNIVPTGELKEKIETTKKEQELRSAKTIIEWYERRIADLTKDYEDTIARVKHNYEEKMRYEKERYEEAVALLSNYE